jgi:FixJ family two-component response regulator
MNTVSSVVFIVDDDPGVRRALTRLMNSAGFEVCSYASALEFLKLHDQNQPGCLLLDLALPGLNGLELQEALTASGCERSIVFISGEADIPKSVRAMKAGAVDFLTKPFEDAVLLAAVRIAVERDTQSRRTRAQRDSIVLRLATLTQREREVLEHVVSGQLNKQIASDLGTVEKTIKVHRGRVMAKMGVTSVAELVRLAEQAGITPVSNQARE